MVPSVSLFRFEIGFESYHRPSAPTFRTIWAFGALASVSWPIKNAALRSAPVEQVAQKQTST
jgi:hypothetical protein